MKAVFLTISIIFLTIINAYSANPGYFEINVRLDKQFYFSNEKINLQIVVKNTSNYVNSFDIYDNKDMYDALFTTFQPVVYDYQGKMAENIVPYRLLRKKISTLLKYLHKRTVHLGSGESFMYSVDIRKIFKLHTHKQYRLRSYFVPDFKKNIRVLSTNSLSFIIKDERNNTKRTGVIRRLKRHIAPQVLTPSEVIMLVLSAEKQRRPFEKYIDLKKYIYAFPEFHKRYKMSDDQNRIQLEKEFVQFLYRERYDYIMKYRVVSETLMKNKASVIAIVHRNGIKKIVRYKYMFTLEKASPSQPFWLISNVEASVMRGVRR